MAISPETLSHFIPFNALQQTVLEQLAATAEARTYAPGERIFTQGESDRWLHLLVKGEVALRQEGQPVRYVRAGSEEARYAIDRVNPHDSTGEAVTGVQLLLIDEPLLERRLGQNQAASYEIVEFSGDGDPQWMMSIITQPAFMEIPAPNISAMFARFEPVHCKAGDVVIRQGEAGDCYYMIREGRVEVTRTEPGKPARILATFRPGEGFGEEALLTGALRNATVTMLTNGVLMRLGKQDFDTLLKAPLILKLDRQEAAHLLKSGAILVDVRLEDEHRASTLKGCINLPLYLLRLRASALKPEKKYILFCQHEERSSAAAFLLAQRGLDVYVLQGGLSSVSGEERVAP